MFQNLLHLMLTKIKNKKELKLLEHFIKRDLENYKEKKVLNFK